MWRPSIQPNTVTWTDSYLEAGGMITYTMKPETYDSDHLEWVRHSYLMGLARERDEAEARAILAEAEADAALTLLDVYATRIEELEERLKGAKHER